MDEFQKHLCSVKESSFKGYILHASIYMTLLQKENYRNSKQTSVCQELGVGGKSTTKRDGGIFFYILIMVVVM